MRRRSLLLHAVSLGACRLAFAGDGAHGTERFVFVLLRGGLDGLYAVPAPGDPEFASARGALARYATPPLALDATFALHPALAELHAMYRRGELLVLHATGVPYRERSHFEAQQLLESGGTRPYELDSGWLGRALQAGQQRGLAIATAVPLALRGAERVDSWAPSTLPEPPGDLVMRLASLYAGDAQLGPALQRARELRAQAGDAVAAMSGAGDTVAARRGAGDAIAAPRGAGAAVALARKAGEFLALPDGPRAAMLEFGSWDSHTNQAAPNGAIERGLAQLDASLAALRDALSPSGHWARSVVVVATEFGREVAPNGTGGTDHGSGGAAFVLGGAVHGGRVVADWPGLAKRDRFEGRDLRITTDLRALLKGALGAPLRLSREKLDREVFPGSGAVAALDLLRV